MRIVALLLAMLMVACASPSYPGIDNPSPGGGPDNRNIIAYIDQRLEEEYYWLDEVLIKGGSFNRHMAWDGYLPAALARLTTNSDDGYIKSNGQRAFYSYIRKSNDTTRATEEGFGIALHYTIAVIDKDNGHYGFIVESIFPASPAEAAGMRRGDIITMVDGNSITQSNYATLFNKIQNNGSQSLRMHYRRQTDGQSYAATLERAAYSPTTVIHSSILDIEGFNKRIGYLAYTSFERDYDEELMAALEQMAQEGVEELILDLRCNGGGALSSAVMLASALLPADYEGKMLCCVRRNPKNTISETESSFLLKNTGSALNLRNVTIICSGYSASASELIIMGLRGLDIPVMLIGTTTEGKNCGMDVTRRKIGNTYYEYAPITFMCFNAKGFGEWGEGITPDIVLTEDNTYGIKDSLYPLPRCPWGDLNNDIALKVAVAHITGTPIASTRHTAALTPTATIEIERQQQGICIYAEREE